jgi:hypothetical protein
MAKYLSLLIASVVMLPGCSGFHTSAPPPPLVMTPELREALKVAHAGALLEDITVDLPEAPWLAARLREVGARLRSDGKMYDRTGREILVWCEGPGGGACICNEELTRQREARERALAEARRRYTVIEVGYWGPQAP